jgi:membrane peptidoglycan carboxypeptidase
MNYYLNRIYFGKGYFGVGAAARGYFGKDASQLTVPECALLAGIIRAPVSSSPRVDPQKAKWRRDQTLKTMYELGDISREDYIRDIETPLRVLPPKPDGRQTYVMVAAVKELENILQVEGTEEMPQGLTVHTNIDLRLQRAIEADMNEQLSALEAAQPPAFRARPSSSTSTPAASRRGLAGATSPRISTTTSRWPGAKVVRCSSRCSTRSPSTGSASRPRR